ncbi:hypothetical protein VTK73DRAFT_9120 [Phialemonium thermophilum]|uniref:Homeobox domain-containing protein n=1 Tax=Phialemonium thermophilum TaxID=223376 RepID=A0ABR3W4Z3_9PEZI
MASHELSGVTSQPSVAVVGERAAFASTSESDDSGESSQVSLAISTGDSTCGTPVAERHPKGRRKRTAAKDKAILEAAYTANPKPDKAARLEIVKRVSLNEKEVQIWFQNRRQNDRRKSRPLSPQEVAALRYGGMQILSSDSIPYDSIRPASASDTPPTQNVLVSGPGSSSSPSSQHDSACTWLSSERFAQDTNDNVSQPLAQSSPPCQAGASWRRSQNSDDSLQLSRSFSGSIGYLSNRWNTESSISNPSHREHDKLDALLSSRQSMSSVQPSSSPPDPSLLPLPNSQSSQLRLSLAYGKAEVVPSVTSPVRDSAVEPTSEGTSAAPVRRPSFQRSRSAHAAVTLPPISALTSSVPALGPRPFLPRLTRGRSRDVHAWEFCCDPDSQEDALTAQAKHESSGSAIAVISLLRSTSSAGVSSSPLQPSNSAKRNAPTRPERTKRQKLARTSSSVARLQTHTVSAKSRTLALPGKESGKRDPEKAKLTLEPGRGSDSDKENWSPDEDGNRHTHLAHQNPHSRRPLPTGVETLSQANLRRGAGRVLQQQEKQHHRLSPLPSLNRANTVPVFGKGAAESPHSPLRIFEDSPACAEMADDEVERFMRGEVSPSKKGDVDAVAGLLSLSQGNWG